MEGNSLIMNISVMTNLIVAFSIVLLWLQIKEMRKQIQSLTYQNLVQMFDNFTHAVLQNPKLASLLFEDKNAEEKIQALWAVFLRFNWFESIVIQKRKFGAIPDDIYDHWMHILEYELSMPFIRCAWQKYGKLYHPLLQLEVKQRCLKNCDKE